MKALAAAVLAALLGFGVCGIGVPTLVKAARIARRDVVVPVIVALHDRARTVR